jgi:hypothetical protein
VDLVSDDEDIMAGDAGAVEKEVALGGEGEEGAAAHDGPPERAAAPPSPPPSA